MTSCIIMHLQWENNTARKCAERDRNVVDSPAMSAWRHFYQQEKSSEGLAVAMLGFQREHEMYGSIFRMRPISGREPDVIEVLDERDRERRPTVRRVIGE